jgi:hypothetical protein
MDHVAQLGAVAAKVVAGEDAAALAGGVPALVQDVEADVGGHGALSQAEVDAEQ